jgi:hypothetical protein
MSAAQLEARRKAGLSTSNPTHACSGAISNAKPDCEEKRDPDKRSLIIQKKENELDPDTQLEKQTFAAPAKAYCQTNESGHSGLRFNAPPCCTRHQGQQCAGSTICKLTDLTRIFGNLSCSPGIEAAIGHNRNLIGPSAGQKCE